ncbi:hypothetical protein ABW20_dc0102226 [Dactylellina cionopaga]|nr:hypothetical protein ABW20_dc0102226 [Dactylellina cionopaga]
MPVPSKILLSFCSIFKLASAYQIGWGEQGELSSINYEDVPTINSPCKKIPSSIGKNVSDIFVRSDIGESPIPEFIALYGTTSTLLKDQGCVDNNILSIYAFYPHLKDRMQGAWIDTPQARWWKEIHPKSALKDYAATLISDFDLHPGNVMSKRSAIGGGSQWALGPDSQIYVQDYNSIPLEDERGPDSDEDEDEYDESDEEDDDDYEGIA